MASNLIIVYVTCPIDRAESIAKNLVERNLAACVNMIPVQSIYYWQEKLCDDEEILLLIKSNLESYAKLEAGIKEIHPYEVPEILAVKAEKASEEYRAWVDSKIIKGQQ
jgi:periplasmic divalent cation tolerance protein